MRIWNILCGAVEGVVGGGGRCERISVRRVGSVLPTVEMKMSVSKPTFLWRVENEMNIILLFEICLMKHISTMRLRFP